MANGGFWHVVRVCALLLWTGDIHAQANLVRIDASAADPPDAALLETRPASLSPAGRTIGATSQYLTLDGKPWLPVMGELHYSRVPERLWEADLLRMKAAGVAVVASYVFWNHHEQDEGRFVWTGDRDIRRFAQLCAKHGMYFFPRIGPWVHGESRHGGFPDWLAARQPLRENDPRYLASVERLFRELGGQLAGLYWKDGGPIIGVQLENEYVAHGAGKGADHIRTLKAMAVAAGIDTPLYTVTGWGNAAAPTDAVLPVFGGYADAPWGDSRTPLPPPEVYAFRFDDRATSDMGAIGGAAAIATATATAQTTPFLTAEVGAGIQDTYFRRPTVSADDIAAMVPVMLGSGVNLLGYYMFVGGRNPDGGATTLQESRRAGDATDLPVTSYDFDAPISNNGQERPSLRRLKLVHYFLNDFGSQLAPMRVRRPARTPASAVDLSVPRVAARTQGDSGFVFFNNHTRGAVMPVRRQFQVALALPHETLRIPEAPMSLPTGAYGIWPVNLDMNGVRLRYSTAQLLTRLDRDDETCLVFFAIARIAPEFVVDADPVAVTAPGWTTRRVASGLRLRPARPTAEFVLHTAGKRVRVIVVSQREAQRLWKVDDGRALLLTSADVFSDGALTTMQQKHRRVFEFALSRDATAHPGQWIATTGLFARYRASVRPVPLTLTARQQAPATRPRDPGVAAPPHESAATVPLAPDDAAFATAAHWRLTLRGDIDAPQLAEALIGIDYDGDVARLQQGERRLDDNFWNGSQWTVGARATKIDTALPIDLHILPLPEHPTMFFDHRPDGRKGPGVSSVRVAPVYQITVMTQRN